MAYDWPQLSTRGRQRCATCRPGEGGRQDVGTVERPVVEALQLMLDSHSAFAHHYPVPFTNRRLHQNEKEKRLLQLTKMIAQVGLQR